MSDYRRLISYIYEYEGKIKGKNVGFVKLEARNGQCRLNLNVKKVYVGGNAVGVYLLGKDGAETFLGNIFIRGGNGEFRAILDAVNVENSGNGLDTYYGLTVHDVKNPWRSYTTIWEDILVPEETEVLPAPGPQGAAGVPAALEPRRVQGAPPPRKPRALSVADSVSFLPAPEILPGSRDLCPTMAVSNVVREIEAEIAREEQRRSREEAMLAHAAEVGMNASDSGAEEMPVSSPLPEIPSMPSPGMPPESIPSIEPGFPAEMPEENPSESQSPERAQVPTPEWPPSSPPIPASPQEIPAEKTTEIPPRLAPELPENPPRPTPEVPQNLPRSMPEMPENPPSPTPELPETPPEPTPEVPENPLRSTPELPETPPSPTPEVPENPLRSTPAPVPEIAPNLPPAPAEPTLPLTTEPEPNQTPSSQPPAAAAPQSAALREPTPREEISQRSPELENPDVLRYLQETEDSTSDPERLWQELRKSYPKIQPFDYENGCEILTIRPQDIGRLPRESWVYGNNSFLLHGYYNFRYIILFRLGSKDGRPRYMIGVPGHYYSSEKYMASMFGFPNFVLSKKQPLGDGRFGYWYTDIKVR